MLFTGGGVLGADELLLDAGFHPKPGQRGPAPATGDLLDLLKDGLRLDQLEDQLVREALERAGGNKSGAAKLLGLSRDQIRYRLDKMDGRR